MKFKLSRSITVLALSAAMLTPVLLATQQTNSQALPQIIAKDSKLTAYSLVVVQAIAAAKSRINASRKCQRFFNEQGIGTIEGTQYSLQDLGPGSLAASVDGEIVFLNVNRKGAFMDPPADFAGLQTADEIRAFYILHELGHELSSFTKFVQDHSASKAVNRFRHDINNDLLKNNCY
jgi:hypothetical protein